MARSDEDPAREAPEPGSGAWLAAYSARFAKTAEDTVRVGTDLVRRSFESYADLVEQSLRTGGVRVGGAEDGQAELTLQAPAGGRAARCGCTAPTTVRRPPSCGSPG
jgi:hypothetical protein